MHQINRILVTVRRMMRLYDSMLKPVCEQYGLAPLEVAIIGFLHCNPSKNTAADIVELRMLSKSNVSQAVESLMGKSLLLRCQDTVDRRRIHLSLTAKAEPITKELESIWTTFRNQIFKGFTKAEQQQFAVFNERIAENAAAAMERGTAP